MARGDQLGRTFACDRIKDIAISTEPFTIPETFEVDKYLRSSFGAFHGEMTKVKIWFSPDAAEYIKEKKWHETQEIVELGDGSILYKAQTAGIHDIKIWVMSWGAKARVIEPKILKEMIKAEIDLLAKLY